jgi:hypothetical protein
MKEGTGSEPTGPAKLMLAVLVMAGRECEDVDVLDRARLTIKSRDRRSQLYFLRVLPRERLRVAHDASTSAKGAMISGFALDVQITSEGGPRSDAYQAQSGQHRLLLMSCLLFFGGDDTFGVVVDEAVGRLQLHVGDTCICTLP